MIFPRSSRHNSSTMPFTHMPCSTQRCDIVHIDDNCYDLRPHVGMYSTMSAAVSGSAATTAVLPSHAGIGTRRPCYMPLLQSSMRSCALQGYFDRNLQLAKQVDLACHAPVHELAEALYAAEQAQRPGVLCCDWLHIHHCLHLRLQNSVQLLATRHGSCLPHLLHTIDGKILSMHHVILKSSSASLMLS